MASSPDAPSDDVYSDDGDEDDGRRRVLAAPFAGVEIQPGPMGPDGAPVPGPVGPQAALPPVDATTCICLRDCRYYWQMSVHWDIGNTEETFDPVLGLRDVVTCPACHGKRGRLVTPALGANGATCDHVPTQGIYSAAAQAGSPPRLGGYPCRLEPGHAGAHHHNPAAPPVPRLERCPRCDDKGYVVDPLSAVVTQPRRVVRSCLRHDGVDTDLNDTIVYDCSEWDPATDVGPGTGFESEAAVHRRIYLERHPELVTIRTTKE